MSNSVKISDVYEAFEKLGLDCDTATDNSGQAFIYTGMKWKNKKQEVLVPMEDEDFE